MEGQIVQESTAWAGGVADELDLALVNALQINPRCELDRLGQVLGVDPVTVGRHWNRLSTAGIAWVWCHPDVRGTFSGWVEIACRPDAVRSVAETLAADPHAVTVARTTGRFDLIVVVVTRDEVDFYRYITERLPRVPGITGKNSHPFRHSYRVDSTRWRLGCLNPDQVEALTDPPRAAPDTAVLTDEWPTVLALTEDGRLPFAELARRTGVSASTATRRLNRLLDADRIVIRCEIARAYSGWPVVAFFWGRVPPTEAGAVASRITGAREVRTCAFTAAGVENICWSAAFRSIGDVRGLEEGLEGYRGLRIINSSLIACPVKLAGVLVDPAGRRTGTVPMDIRRDPVPPPDGG